MNPSGGAGVPPPTTTLSPAGYTAGESALSGYSAVTQWVLSGYSAVTQWVLSGYAEGSQRVLAEGAHDGGERAVLGASGGVTQRELRQRAVRPAYALPT